MSKYVLHLFRKKVPFLKCCRRSREELQRMMAEEPILTLGDDDGNPVEHVHVSCYLTRLTEDDLGTVRSAAQQFVADIIAHPERIVIEHIRLLQWHRKIDVCPICSHYLLCPWPVLDTAVFHDETYSVQCDWCPICGFALPHLPSVLPSGRDYDLKAVAEFLSWEPWAPKKDSVDKGGGSDSDPR